MVNGLSGYDKQHIYHCIPDPHSSYLPILPPYAFLPRNAAFAFPQHAPSYVVSALIKQAYDDGCDYFYQINDDTVINSPGWAETFTRILQTNPLGRNVGVTGPADTNNRRILTHAFVHRCVESWLCTYSSV